MNGSQQPTRNKGLVIGAVVGTLAVAAAGAGIISAIYYKKKHLQRELELLTRCSEASTKTCQSEYFSAKEEDDDEDFLDCTDDSPEEIQLFEKVDILMKESDKERLEAFYLLKEHESDMSKSANFLWRLAKAYQIRAASEENKEMKKEYIYKGLEKAKKALEVDEDNPEAHKWYAILVGMQSDYLPLKEKIQNGQLFKEHILIAIKRRPKDFSLHYLIGRFKFEIAKVSWYEKKIAASFFDIPDFQITDAIKDLLKAEDFSPEPWKANRLLLAKCFLEEKNYGLAFKWLERAKKIQPKTAEDRICDIEINDLMCKYRSYSV